MRIVFQIEGMELLDRKLAALPRKVATKVVRQAVRRAQKILLDMVRTWTMRLPVSLRRAGEMAEAIAGAWEIRAPKRQISASYALHVTLKNLPLFFHKSKRTGKTSYIPAAIEYGHGATRETAARPYARTAADASNARRQQILAEELGKGIEQVAMESP